MGMETPNIYYPSSKDLVFPIDVSKERNNKKIKHQRNFLVTAGHKPITFSRIATAAVARGHYPEPIRPLA
jgi:hypothetical protein